jgi:hypothetical protein
MTLPFGEVESGLHDSTLFLFNLDKVWYAHPITKIAFSWFGGESGDF